MSLRSYLHAASLLIAATFTHAQTPPKPAAISVMTGPVVARASAAAVTPAAANPAAEPAPAQPKASTIMINVGGMGAAAPAAARGNGTMSAGVPLSTGGVAAQNVWVIKAGSSNGSLTFSPDTITGAKVGDMVQFQFYPRNHSVVMGDYANACAPNPNRAAAFFSGFMPTDQMGRLTYSVRVRDTNPMWIYCSQGKHCQEGMVGVINPPATGQTLVDYRARAARATVNMSPIGSTAGQIGGTRPGAAAPKPSGPLAARPSAAAAKSRASSSFHLASWLLALVAAAMCFLV